MAQEQIEQVKASAEKADGSSGAGSSSSISRMGTASIPRLIVEFAIPSIAGMVVNGAYNVIDSVFLGQAMGATGQAVMTAANPIMVMFMALAMLIGNGGNALCALRLGEGRHEDAERCLGMTVTLGILIAAVVAFIALCPITVDFLLSLTSATPEILDQTRLFVRILSAGFIFQLIGMGVNNFIRTAGAPNRALGTMVIGAVACTAFNYLFVIVFGWGVAGSALATISGQAASFVSVLWYFLFTPGVPLKLRLRLMGLKVRVVGRICALGSPRFILQVGIALVAIVSNAMLVKYGSQHPLGADNALASIGVVTRLTMFSIFPLIGTAVALQPLLGFNYGARLIARVRKTYFCGIAGATGIALVLWVIVQAFSHQIIGAFGLRDPQLVDFTAFALRVQLMMLPLVGFQIVTSNYFQATGQPAKSIFLSLTRQILFLIPCYLALPIILPGIFSGLTGLDAIYFAPPVADAISIFVAGCFAAFELKRLKKIESGSIKVHI